MTAIVKIIDIGSTEIQYRGDSIILPNEVILHAADQIRLQVGITEKPDVPRPAGPIGD